MKEIILDDFKSNKVKLDSFRDRIFNLLQDLFSHADIKVHQISCRTKELESLSKKIDNKFGKYKTLYDITDLVGLRVITYLESQVDEVSNLIEKEFNIDPENSIDKRVLKTDQFGYRSLHIVVSINDSRAALTEYESYKNLKCEIQIRSILQHTWAEIEHDLGYKGKLAIPNSHARSFNRLSALLETADIEFDRLKKELDKYEKEVPALISENSQNVLIDQATIKYFLESNPIMIEARNIIGEISGAKFTESFDYSFMLNKLELFKIETISDLEKILVADRQHFLKFIKIFLGNDKYEFLPDNLPLFYFEHFLAGKSGDEKLIQKYSLSLGGDGDFIGIYQKSIED